MLFLALMFLSQESNCDCDFESSIIIPKIRDEYRRKFVLDLPENLKSSQKYFLREIEKNKKDWKELRTEMETLKQPTDEMVEKEKQLIIKHKILSMNLETINYKIAETKISILHNWFSILGDYLDPDVITNEYANRQNISYPKGFNGYTYSEDGRKVVYQKYDPF